MCTVLSGCGWWASLWEDDVVVETPPVPVFVEGTIGQFGQYIGYAERSVQGYGVVVGLGQNGSSEVPGEIQKYLVRYMFMHKLGFWRHNTQDLHPAKILRDLDTAVVLVAGEIPHGAPVGTTFDLQVASLDGTNTRSLDGGVLMPAELRLAIGDMAAPGGPTFPWAEGTGGVFISPVLDMSKPAMRAELRRGRILGGGKVTKYRPVRLLLRDPSVRLARQIQSRLNQRFRLRGSTHAVATAKNDQTIEIRVPQSYAQDYKHFLELVLHLPLAPEAARSELQTQRILKAMNEPEAVHHKLALSLEAIGSDIIPMLQPQYASEDDTAAYYAARVGLRLGDATAGPVVFRMAQTADSPMQVQAIKELGRHRLPGTINALRPLLDDRNWLVRLAAYESLVKLGDKVRIRRTMVRKGMVLDVVQSSGEPVIYATQSGEPRIAVFGGDLPVSDPMFFSLPDDLVTISDTKSAAGSRLMLYRKIPRSTQPSDMFYIDFNTSDLIRTLGGATDRNREGKVMAMSLAYSQVLQVLRGLCESKTGALKARFELQAIGESTIIRQGDGMGIRPDTPAE